MKRKSIPKKDTADAWQDVLSRACQAFAYYHWWFLGKSKPSFATDSTCITIKNAALESSLMSIRDLDDFFFSSPNARQDDLIASDYGFPPARNFLTGPERGAINKKLAHLTYLPTHERRQSPIQKAPPTWNNAEMVNRAISRLLEFLNHLESSFLAGNPAQVGMIRTARNTLQRLLMDINNVPRAEMNFTA